MRRSWSYFYLLDRAACCHACLSIAGRCWVSIAGQCRVVSRWSVVGLSEHCWRLLGGQSAAVQPGRQGRCTLPGLSSSSSSSLPHHVTHQPLPGLSLAIMHSSSVITASTHNTLSLLALWCNLLSPVRPLLVKSLQQRRHVSVSRCFVVIGRSKQAMHQHASAVCACVLAGLSLEYATMLQVYATVVLISVLCCCCSMLLPAAARAAGTVNSSGCMTRSGGGHDKRCALTVLRPLLLHASWLLILSVCGTCTVPSSACAQALAASTARPELHRVPNKL